MIDPDTGTIYLTEDAGSSNGLLYCQTPPAAVLRSAGACCGRSPVTPACSRR